MDQKSRAKIEEPLSLNILERSSTGLNGEFLHSQLLINVLLRMKPNEKDKQDLVALCKNEYKKNEDEIKLVNEFERHYHSSKAIWWYTRESFVYRMLNKALRVQNVNVLFLFRAVIQDLHVQLYEHQCQESVRVYRGQWMLKVEVDHLRNSIGNLISMNSFLSTSLDRNVASRFLQYNESMTGSEDFEAVLFEIDADPQIISSAMAMMNKDYKPFAKVSEFSDIGDECEVLFMLGSIFCLNQIYDDPSASSGVHASRMSIIRMTLSSSDHDNDLKRLYHHMRKQYDDEEETNLLSLADVMRNMGKFDLAEKYYRRLLSELSSSHPSLSQLYYNLGRVADAQGEYDTSLKWYEKSLEIKKRTRPSDHVTIGITHNSIGEVHRKRDDLDRALESYNRAVSLFEQAHDDNHPHMASFYNNIGLIYQQQQKYVKALDFYEKSLAIQRKHPPSDHPDLGTSYNNIGIVHRCLGHCDVALEYFNRSLEIKLKALPTEHPSVAMTDKNMGLVYEDKGELEQALTFWRRRLLSISQHCRRIIQMLWRSRKMFNE